MNTRRGGTACGWCASQAEERCTAGDTRIKQRWGRFSGKSTARTNSWTDSWHRGHRSAWLQGRAFCLERPRSPILTAGLSGSRRSASRLSHFKSKCTTWRLCRYSMPARSNRTSSAWPQSTDVRDPMCLCLLSPSCMRTRHVCLQKTRGTSAHGMTSVIRAQVCSHSCACSMIPRRHAALSC